ncbi:MAG TPA: hypothetical protein VEC36_08790 [Patescibacteria group bacterium]|nr:hypothetical protein [Patescibacteria group bacterium]
MNDFLCKIGLIDTLKMELPISEEEFVKIFREKVGGFDFKTGENYWSPSNEYRGYLRESYFKIKTRPSLFMPGYGSFVYAIGTFKQHQQNTLLEITVSSISAYVYIFYGIVTIITLWIVIMSFLGKVTDNSGGVAIIFMITFLFMITGIQVLAFKRYVQHMKVDLQRDFYNLAKVKPTF